LFVQRDPGARAGGRRRRRGLPLPRRIDPPLSPAGYFCRDDANGGLPPRRVPAHGWRHRRAAFGLAAVSAAHTSLAVAISACTSSMPRRLVPQRPLPPCGGGTGRGVATSTEFVVTPLPTPPPPGGGGQAALASRARICGAMGSST